ncbi:hypothetical protein [Streptomyces sp.]|uniref:hypothetical protein n=1 Tax=Streptomyces sp. TaxID=1931 RepID=UPI002F9333D1
MASTTPRLGRFHLNAYQQHRSFLTDAEDTRLSERAHHQIRTVAPFLDTLLANATGKRSTPEHFLDQLAAAIPGMPFLGYLYFEVLSEYLIPASTRGTTVSSSSSKASSPDWPPTSPPTPATGSPIWSLPSPSNQTRTQPPSPSVTPTSKRSPRPRRRCSGR